MKTIPRSIRWLRRGVIVRLRATAVTLATLLLLSGVADLGCGSDASEECDAGETRDCPCSPSCGYDRCGICPSIAVAVSGDETCSADGTWGKCSCQEEVEPECSGDSCGDQCSAILRAALRELPSGGSETDCRAAFAEVQKCVGTLCEPTPIVDGTCSAELTALDEACLGQGQPCPAVQ